MKNDVCRGTHTYTVYILVYIIIIYTNYHRNYIEIIRETTVEIRGCQRKDKVDFLNFGLTKVSPIKYCYNTMD